MFKRMARCIRRAILNVYLGSEPTSAAQNRNVFSLPVEGPLPKVAPNRFATAAKVRNPPILLKNSDFVQNWKIFPRTMHLKNFGEGPGKRRVPSPVASLWNLSRQSSMSFRKSVYLAEKSEVQFCEFFNRIGGLC